MRTARLLAVSALTAATVAAAAPTAWAESASVTPRTVSPGSTVTINVECGFTQTSSTPNTITANSQAFANGTATLHLVGSGGMPGAGGQYQGTARIAGASHFTNSGPNPVGSNSEWSVDGSCPGGGQWNASFTVHRTPGGVHGGIGGTFTESTTAIATGAVLVAGALGATIMTIRRRSTES
ncbi:hypothetical protein [Streptomyces indicus]|uniref:Neocarzinostatin family protein n=1 Tax=Streptomyces indicus TaxID=417292 RepID=A0A1G9GIV0_9ACTN|nr:hypothetical protein [Streptomyces indicus]SDL00532.1 hypothetical protein SAMN05421806_11620 [Streptomyces indicus]